MWILCPVLARRTDREGVVPSTRVVVVDIGLERDAFLYVSDFMELEDSEDLDDVPTNRPAPERYPQ